MSKQVWLRHTLGIVLVALVLRKVFIGHQAMKIVESCKSQVAASSMLNSTVFQRVARSMSIIEPTMVLILNKHALNMTLNWLCNTQGMPDVHRRSLIVTLDSESDAALKRSWPGIKRLNWPVSCLKDAFNYGDGKYQLFYLFRSNLAYAFLQFNKPFWMIQQDTFWRTNMLDLNLDNEDNAAKDILFDRAAESAGSLIAGGYYLARPTQYTKNFFKRLSNDLASLYTPDNAYMTYLCADRKLVRCGQIPFSTITNWIWLHEPSRFKSFYVPMLVQFDGDTKLGGKLAKMRALGFYFLESDGVSCNDRSVRKAQERVLKWAGMTGSLDASNVRSYSHLQFGLYQTIIDQLYKFEATEYLLNNVIFPYAHYFMITL